MMPNSYRYYSESVVKRETLKTDATGKATLTLDTPQSGNALEYRIEARVTDASRREIVGGDSIRVSQRLYQVTAVPEHNLYRPQDKVTVDFKALDANEQPQQVEGKVTVTRNAWREVWLDTNNKEVVPAAGRRLPEGWRIKRRGYETETILTRTLKTDAKGEAELVFTPERDGYYQVNWYSEDRDGDPVEANTSAWVASNTSTDIGMRTDGVQIIVDKTPSARGRRRRCCSPPIPMTATCSSASKATICTATSSFTWMARSSWCRCPSPNSTCRISSLMRRWSAIGRSTRIPNRWWCRR
jgi:uncharacterized protein YfaS (alpha-2-macroglobulin family)